MLRVFVVLTMLILAAPSFAQTGWPKSGQPAATQTDAPAPPPIMLNMPDTSSGPLGWVFAIIAGLTGGGHVLGQFLGKSASPAAPVDHDAIKQTIHDAIVQLVQSGALAPAVQTGLGLIPGAGGLASQFEPLIRKIVLEVLTHGSAAPITSPVVMQGDLGDKIKAGIDQALNDFLKRQAGPFPASPPPA
jgi:hypothetical protein